MAQGRHAMTAFQVRNRLLATFNAVEKIANVATKLIELIARLVTDCRRPKLGFHRLANSCDAADRLPVGCKLRYCVLGTDRAVRRDGVAIARDRQRAFRSIENKAGTR